MGAPRELARRFVFAGKEQDIHTGLIDLGARSYDARQGQWLSPDPILARYFPLIGHVPEQLPGMGGVFATGNLNAYAYAWNSPMTYSDRNGEEVIIAGSFLPRRIAPDPSMQEHRGLTSTLTSWRTRLNPTRAVLDIVIERVPSRTFYHPKTNPQLPDRYVPGRTLDQHEAAHANVAENFYTKDVVDLALEQVDLTGDLPKGSQAQVQKAAEDVTEFLEQYQSYIDNRLLHEEARAGGDTTYAAPILPGYRDADGVYHGVTQSQADDVLRIVSDRSGVPH